MRNEETSGRNRKLGSWEEKHQAITEEGYSALISDILWLTRVLIDWLKNQPQLTTLFPWKNASRWSRVWLKARREGTAVPFY